MILHHLAKEAWVNSEIRKIVGRSGLKIERRSIWHAVLLLVQYVSRNQRAQQILFTCEALTVVLESH